MRVSIPHRLSRVVAALAVCLCLVGPGERFVAAEERSAPQAMAERLQSAPLLARDPLDLAVRLRGLSAATPLALPGWPVPPVAGLQENFWILDQRTAQLFQAGLTLRLVTNHAYWFVDSDLLDRAPLSDLQRSANVFETTTFPLIRKYFGSDESAVAPDGDDHIVVLLGNVPGVAAYFSSADAYPRAINPRSNQHRMIYVNLNSLRPGQAGFDSTLAHELTHLVNFNHCSSQEGWLDEGAAELGMRVAGFDGPPPVAFAAHPDTQLNTWTKQPIELPRHYQAAYLFLRYVAERAGGWDALPVLFSSCARGEALFSAFLRQQPIAPDLETLFTEWTLANLLQDPSVADGRYAYANTSFHAVVTGSASMETPFLGSVPQYAVNYLDLPAGAGNVTFSGDTSVPLLAAPADGGGVWWSNRGDSIDVHLSRRIDLTGVGEATLRFQVWYDLEDQFDFVYLSASADGGQRWYVLPGVHSSGDDATGNNYGAGWTGTSHFSWVGEEVDLTPFVGAEVMLRFDYVTDQSYTGQGFAFKDMRIPQRGLNERIRVDDPAWTAEGWVRVDSPIPEPWNLRRIRWTPAGVQIDVIPVGPDATARFDLDESASRSVLVIAPTAPRTVLPGNYSVSVTRPTQ